MIGKHYILGQNVIRAILKINLSYDRFSHTKVRPCAPNQYNCSSGTDLLCHVRTSHYLPSGTYVPALSCPASTPVAWSGSRTQAATRPVRWRASGMAPITCSASVVTSSTPTASSSTYAQARTLVLQTLFMARTTRRKTTGSVSPLSSVGLRSTSASLYSALITNPAATFPMANLTTQAFSFQYKGDLTQDTEEQLDAKGYYFGYPCAHNHVIRHKETHACYQCSHKIVSNICGFDVNYLNTIYKHKYVSLWSQIEIGALSDCWELKPESQIRSKRICMPSYRSGYSRQKAENVTLQKSIYQCAWGDVGTLSVTRTCKNSNCLNPLHLVTVLNRAYPPQVISPFETEFEPEKLMCFSKHQQEGTLHSFLARQYKFSVMPSRVLKEGQE